MQRPGLCARSQANEVHAQYKTGQHCAIFHEDKEKSNPLLTTRTSSNHGLFR